MDLLVAGPTSWPLRRDLAGRGGSRASSFCRVVERWLGCWSGSLGIRVRVLAQAGPFTLSDLDWFACACLKELVRRKMLFLDAH